MDRETAIRFLTTKVAKIIYDTVSCDLPDRAESDWVVAEEMVRERFESIIRIMLAPKTRFYTNPRSNERMSLPEDCTYEDFDRVMGFLVWTQTQPLRSLLPHPPYGNITFF